MVSEGKNMCRRNVNDYKVILNEVETQYKGHFDSLLFVFWPLKLLTNFFNVYIFIQVQILLILRSYHFNILIWYYISYSLLKYNSHCGQSFFPTKSFQGVILDHMTKIQWVRLNQLRRSWIGISPWFITLWDRDYSISGNIVEGHRWY